MARRVIRLVIGALAVVAVSLPLPAFARGNPGHGGGGGGRPPNAGTETVGNNLSYPAVFAEGVGITGLTPTAADGTLPAWQQTWTGLRIPSPTNPVLSAADVYDLNGVPYYLQGQEGSSWQAGWINGATATTSPWTAYVKWGDNLLGTVLPSSGGTAWTTTSTIHIEVAMKSTQNAGYLPGGSGLQYFPTQALYGSGNTETYGTTGIPTTVPAGATDPSALPALPASIYSDAAYLIIQPVSSDGSVGTPIHVLKAWARTVEGPSTTALTPEVNAGGNVVYSFNWFAGRDHLAAGSYKLTFGVATAAAPNSLVGTPTTLGNVTIAGVVAPGAVEGTSGAPVTCGNPVTVEGTTIPLDCSSSTNSSSLTIQLVSGSTGGGGGHGGGGGGGGTGGGGGGGHGGGTGSGS